MNGMSPQRSRIASRGVSGATPLMLLGNVSHDRPVC